MAREPVAFVFMALLVAYAACPSKAVAQATTSEERVLVRLEVTSGASRPNAITAENLQKWSEAQKIARAFPDALGGSVKDVIERHVAPRSVGRTIELNKSSAISEVVADSRRLWIAPFGTAKPRAKARPSQQRALPTYRLALPEEMSRVVSDQAEQQAFKVFVPDVHEPGELVSKRRTIQMELTRAELQSLHEADPNLRTETLNGKFKVATEASPAIGATPIKPEVEVALSKLFKGRKVPAKKPLLIVVDDTWPTSDAFLATKNLIGSVFLELWRANSDIAARAPELSMETKKLASPGAPKGRNCPTLEQCDSHAKRVDLSLAPMRKFAKAALGDEPVDIMYVPMTASQEGAKDVLRLLWNLAYAAGTPLAPNSPTFFEEDTTKARQENEFFSTLDEQLRGSEFTSNWAILTGVIHFARRYSVVKETPVYLSLSWTTEDTATFNSPVLTEWGTLIVAAAGNHCDKDSCGKFADELGPDRQFVKRAYSPIDVLLVVNVNDNGMPTCNSTRVQTSYSVVGFDGAIDGDCGTSFAAPRVAWLMAARYAMTGARTSWKTEQRDRLRWLMNRPERKKCGGDGDYPCIRFPIVEFLTLKARQNNQ